VSIDATPRLGDFLKSLYKCQYGTMFDAFPTVRRPGWRGGGGGGGGGEQGGGGRAEGGGIGGP
jgi:hypothetical protein